MCSVFSIECFLYTCSFQWASGHLDDDCGGSSCNGSAAVGESSGSKPLKPLFESRGPRTCMHAYASTIYACTIYASSMPNIRVPSGSKPLAVLWSTACSSMVVTQPDARARRHRQTKRKPSGVHRRATSGVQPEAAVSCRYFQFAAGLLPWARRRPSDRSH